MPAARTDDEHRRLVAELVGLAGLRVGEVDLPGPAILQVDLALDHVGPDRRGRILEIGHEDPGAGIQRVDDHLAVDRAGDLDAAVLKIGRDRRDLPVAGADRSRLGQEVRQAAIVEEHLPLLAEFEQRAPVGIEPAMQLGHEGQRLGRQDFVEARGGRAGDDETVGIGGHGVLLRRKLGWRQPCHFAVFNETSAMIRALFPSWKRSLTPAPARSSRSAPLPPRPDRAPP